MAAAASAADGQLSLRIGLERTTGDYGGTEDLTDVFVPVTLQYARERFGLRVTAPYLKLEFADPTIAAGSPGRIYSESGLGDVMVGLTFYDLYRSRDGTLIIDLTGKIKLATADDARGLGSGENDYSLETDIYKRFGRTALTGTIGYKTRGDPVGIIYEDGWLFSLGGLYRFSDRTSGGLFIDHRTSAVAGSPAIQELTGSITHRLQRPWRLQVYLVHGLSDGSADLGIGTSVRRDF
jgi:hypothetical protein